MGLTAGRRNELLDDLAVGEAAASRAYAVRLRALAELADLTGCEQEASGIEQFVSMELAGTCRKGRIGAGNDLADAVRFVETLPETVRLLAAGELFVHQARVLLEVTANASAEVAAAVERRLLPAGVELAPPDLRRAARRAVLAVESELDSAAVLERLGRARAGRRVWVRPIEDGMALIAIVAPAEHAVSWSAELDRLVAAEKAADHVAGVWRSADQIRVDLLLAMPASHSTPSASRPTGPGSHQPDGQPAGGRPEGRVAATIVVHVPAATVLGYADAPGHLDGYGPISAEHVRLLLPGAELRRLLVDSDTGGPLCADNPPATRTRTAIRARTATRARAAGSAGSGSGSGGEEPGDGLREWLRAFLTEPGQLADRIEPQHDPSAGLRRFIQLRDGHCRGVGCSTPARRCHLDHRIPYPAGPTSAANLHALSASCHRAKHAGWHTRTHADGTTSWTSPLGRTYHRPPSHQPPPLLRAAPRAAFHPPPPRTGPPDSDECGTDEPLELQRGRDSGPAPSPPLPTSSARPDDPPF